MKIAYFYAHLRLCNITSRLLNAIYSFPIFSQVVDPRQVTIASDKLENEPKRFTVRHEVDIPVQVPDSAGEGQLEATVLGPDQMSVPSTVTKESDGYHIRFVPRQTGQHKVMVMYGGKEVSGSPYAVRIRDATNKKVKVKEMEEMRTGYSTQKEVRGERMRII